MRNVRHPLPESAASAFGLVVRETSACKMVTTDLNLENCIPAIVPSRRHRIEHPEPLTSILLGWSRRSGSANTMASSRAPSLLTFVQFHRSSSAPLPKDIKDPLRTGF